MTSYHRNKANYCPNFNCSNIFLISKKNFNFYFEKNLKFLINVFMADRKFEPHTKILLYYFYTFDSILTKFIKIIQTNLNCTPIIQYFYFGLFTDANLRKAVRNITITSASNHIFRFVERNLLFSGFLNLCRDVQLNAICFPTS